MLIGFGNAYSQSISDSLLVDFFNRTFNDYFSNQKVIKKDYYIVKDSSMPENIKTDYANFTLHFIDDWYQVCPLIKSGEIDTIYWVKKDVSVNNINVFISSYRTGFLKGFNYIKGENGKRRLKYIKSCSYSIQSGIVLMSNGKLIYDSESGEWKHTTGEEIWNSFFLK